MQYDEFITRVHHRVDISQPEKVELAIQAVMETLGESLSEDEAMDLAAQLPKEMQGYLRPGGPRLEEQPSPDAFYQRVGLRADVEPDAARRYVEAVVAVLCQAVSAGQLVDVMRELPDDFIPFFEAVHPGLSRGVMPRDSEQV